MSVFLPANAARTVSWLARTQAPLQAFLRPALWSPFGKRAHLDKQTWEVDQRPSEAFRTFLSAIEQCQASFKLIVSATNPASHTAQVLCFTNVAEWLDVIEIEFREAEHGSIAEVIGFSSGVVPLLVPFAPILNVALFLIPFSDHQFNRKRLNLIRENMAKTCRAELVKRK
eukprot:m.110082 g.110082  ORF g.110082 m.110082 type:complete len:171 (+) comp51791_c0_seq2:53-565(+)